MGAADGARRCRRTPRRDDPDLDGAVRPRRVRPPPTEVGVRGHRPRLRGPDLPVRPVREGIGRPSRSARDRRERDVLGRRVALLPRRAASAPTAGLGRASFRLRRDPARRVLRRLGRDRRGGVDDGRRARPRVSCRRGQLRRLHLVRLAPAGRADLARVDVRVRQPDRRGRPGMDHPRRGRDGADGRRGRGRAGLGGGDPSRRKLGARTGTGAVHPRSRLCGGRSRADRVLSRRCTTSRPDGATTSPRSGSPSSDRRGASTRRE